MTPSPDVDALMVGHFARDRLVVDGVSEYASGGAVYYGSVALARLGIRAAVVTRVHPSDFSLLDDLRAEGIRVHAVPAPVTTRLEDIYDSSDMERRICRLKTFAGPFQPGDIDGLSARVYLVTPVVAGEVDLPMLKSLASRGPVGLDIQGFVRFHDNGNLVFRRWPDMAEGLAHVTYLKVDRAEAELLTSRTDMRVAARELAAYGPREVIVTQSSGVTVYADGQMYEAPFTPRSLAGRTGRGDTCFATYVGRRLTTPPEEAVRFAAAVTTLKQERPGPWRGRFDDVTALLADSRQ